MTYMMLPFAGLSLLLHLIIIGVASLFALFRKGGKEGKGWLLRGDYFSAGVWQVLSVITSVVLISVASTMILFTMFMLIKTGLNAEGPSWAELMESELHYVRERAPTDFISIKN